MNKVFLSVFLLSFLFLAMSCKKTLGPADKDKLSFIVRLPSITIARFEAYCATEDIFLDQVNVQSPSALYFTEEYNHQRIAKDEIFIFGNHAAEDGLWLITFVGSSAITNADFNIIVPYEMVIIADDNE